MFCSVSDIPPQAWTKNCDEAVAKMLFCQISYSTGQSNTTNSTGDIQTDEGNEQQDLGLPCSLGERNEAEGHKECNFNLEFSDCFLGNSCTKPIIYTNDITSGSSHSYQGTGP